jgi:hypothetical protein
VAGFSVEHVRRRFWTTVILAEQFTAKVIATPPLAGYPIGHKADSMGTDRTRLALSLSEFPVLNSFSRLQKW